MKKQLLMILLFVGTMCMQAGVLEQVIGNTFIVSYDPAEWSVDAIDPPAETIMDVCMFSSLKSSEYVGITFYDSQVDAKQHLSNYLATQTQGGFLDGAQIVEDVKDSRMWGLPVYYALFTKEMGTQDYAGTVVAGNVNGGLILIWDMSADPKNLKFFDLLDEIQFRNPWGTGVPVPPMPPQVEVIEVIEDEPEIEEIEIVDAPVEGEGDDVIYTVCEKMPEFPGGIQAMSKFFEDNLQYPQDAGEINVQGRSIIQFTVERDGSITDVEVVRSVGHPSFDKEAVRVIKMMPKWKPGSQRNKIVRCKYTVPVTFKLKNIVPLNSESFNMEYDADKWTMEPVSAPDTYLFTYKPFYEMVSIQFLKGDTTDAKQFIQEQVIGKADAYFADATVTDNIGQSTLFGSSVYLTVYLSPWGEQTYKGMVLTSNTHGGFFLVVTASANYNNSEALQLIKTIRFKQ